MMTIVQNDCCHGKGRELVRVWSDCQSSLTGCCASTFMNNRGKWLNIHINRSESISYLMEPQLQLKHTLGPDVLPQLCQSHLVSLESCCSKTQWGQRRSWSSSHNGGRTWELVPIRDVMSLVLGHTKVTSLLQHSVNGGPQLLGRRCLTFPQVSAGTISP